MYHMSDVCSSGSVYLQHMSVGLVVFLAYHIVILRVQVHAKDIWIGGHKTDTCLVFLLLSFQGVRHRSTPFGEISTSV